jgi:hypothetical protein
MTTPGVYEFAATGPIDISLRMHSGDVTVTAVEHPVVLVTLTPEDGSESSHAAVDATVVVFDGHQLRLETSPRPTGWPGLRRGRVRANLSVPFGQHALRPAGLGRPPHERTARRRQREHRPGDVNLLETGGDVSVDSGSGDVYGGRIGGRCEPTPRPVTSGQ